MEQSVEVRFSHIDQAVSRATTDKIFPVIVAA
jgi:hypothetical protein